MFSGRRAIQKMSNLRSPKRIFIYGPPGSGKSTLGEQLSRELSLSYLDLDKRIVNKSGMDIPSIFNNEGEEKFRNIESRELNSAINEGVQVIALGGGALLDESNRSFVEKEGTVICLHSPLNVLIERLKKDNNKRPLVSLNLESQLTELMDHRKSHYASFSTQLDSTKFDLSQICDQAQKIIGMFRVYGEGYDYDVRVNPGGIDLLGEKLRNRGFLGPVCIVSDQNVARYYMERAIASVNASGYSVNKVVVPPGEENKTIKTVNQIWEGFLNSNLERNSTVVALGGGVIGDLAGFAAATYKRGIRWVIVPTSLLAMVDASLGGKTGADLSYGKNLIGSFHHPGYILVDPETLKTLPVEEIRNGLAETVKHGIIADPDLFYMCRTGIDKLEFEWFNLISSSMKVKIKVIQKDPYEKGERAVLNLGHSLGHAIESASSYSIKHGEAVSIGMVTAARISEKLGIGESGIEDTISSTLNTIGLSVKIPESLDRKKIKLALGVDKKRAAGKLRAVLPIKIGEVRWGVKIDDEEFLKEGGI
jgi:shikimate kinase/3-dehydroquinate synthase